MDAIILETIKKYYQGEIPPESPGFFKTLQYNRLKSRKKQACKNRPLIIKKVINILKNNNPEYDYREIPYWGSEDIDVCYTFEVLLNKNCHFYEYDADGDRKTLKETGGIMKTLKIHISILGPFFTYKIFNLWLEGKNDWKWDYDKEIKSDHKKLWEAFQELFKQCKYKLLDKSVLTEIIPWIYLETRKKGEANIFHCLFSEFYDID